MLYLTNQITAFVTTMISRSPGNYLVYPLSFSLTPVASWLPPHFKKHDSICKTLVYTLYLEVRVGIRVAVGEVDSVVGVLEGMRPRQPIVVGLLLCVLSEVWGGKGRYG